jgi:hypothetical protein
MWSTPATSIGQCISKSPGNGERRRDRPHTANRAWPGTRTSLPGIIDIGFVEDAAPLYPETVILAAMGAGGHHSRHADNCRQNEQGDWVANHTPHRDVSAIYYLNEEFDGGEIVFERQQLTVKPRRGLLLAFPSDAEHVHEVFPVRGGVRYTMPIWLTKQACFALAMSALAAP